jgi:hypothetical protein
MKKKIQTLIESHSFPVDLPKDLFPNPTCPVCLSTFAVQKHRMKSSLLASASNMRWEQSGVLFAGKTFVKK